MLSLLCIIHVYLIVPVSGAISAIEAIRIGTASHYLSASFEVMDTSLLTIYAAVLATNVITTILIGVKSWSVQIQLRSMIS